MGRAHSEATKAKIAAALRGRRASAETKLKMSRVRKGVPKSAATRKKMSEAASDKSRPGIQRRNDLTSVRNALRLCDGTAFGVKGYFEALRNPAGRVPYRSALERRLMQLLDVDETVREWRSPVTVRYQDAHGRKRHALPDLYVVYVTGKTAVIEVKGPHLMARYIQSEKFRAVREWCQQQGHEFSVATTKDRLSKGSITIEVIE